MTWYIEKYIGSGGIGRIYLVRNIETNQLAIRKFNYRGRIIQDEYNIVKKIQEVNEKNFFVKPIIYEEPYFYMEYLENYETLYNLFRNQWFWTFDMKKKIIKNIKQAVEILHKFEIAHRDLKPNNIMVRFDGHIKIIDFGSACSNFQCKDKSLISTRNYLPTHFYIGGSYDFNKSQFIDLFALSRIINEINHI